jgi:hypothetical protein
MGKTPLKNVFFPGFIVQNNCITQSLAYAGPGTGVALHIRVAQPERSGF